jgi:hypothetical protein
MASRRQRAVGWRSTTAKIVESLNNLFAKHGKPEIELRE